MAIKIREEDLSHMLPTEGYQKGWRLTWLPPRTADPVVLEATRRPRGQLYRWDYIPSLAEVFEICQELAG